MITKWYVSFKILQANSSSNEFWNINLVLIRWFLPSASIAIPSKPCQLIWIFGFQNQLGLEEDPTPESKCPSNDFWLFVELPLLVAEFVMSRNLMTIVTPVFLWWFFRIFCQRSSQEEMWAGFSSEDRAGGMAKVERMMKLLKEERWIEKYWYQWFNEEKHIFSSMCLMDFEGTTLVKTPLVKKKQQICSSFELLVADALTRASTEFHFHPYKAKPGHCCLGVFLWTSTNLGSGMQEDEW